MKKLIFGLSLLSFTAQADGISPYLPLQISPEIETYIEKLFAVTPAAPLAKPYKASDLLSRLNQVKNTHPRLYGRLDTYLQRYKKSFGKTHTSVTLSTSDSNATLPNQRGVRYDDNYQLSNSAFYQASPYFLANLGVTKASSGGPKHYASYLAFGYEYAQIELGYREHWFSPFVDSAMLVSTNAKPTASFTISNATPITDWNLRYEFFYTQLDRVEQIRLGDEYHPGKPKLAGMHLSFTPTDNWTVGLNRTLQFGGGKRTAGFKDFVDAFFNPAGKDNIDVPDQVASNNEFGNQIASITSKWNVNLGMPVSLYAEYGGEDTLNESNYQLGNQTLSFGVHLPMLTDSIGVRYEVSRWATHWYVHHIYPSGYTNQGNVLGHWGGDMRNFGDDVKALAHSLNLDWQLASNQLLNINLKALDNEAGEVNYDLAYQLQARYSYATASGFWGVEASVGKDVYGENTQRLALFYRW